ncbi:S41 family peptidase [Candidatus Parcubacteria bacterium]|nr:MAG: S41 family peptidase [Candidatus Parcubacteria bacterium]
MTKRKIILGVAGLLLAAGIAGGSFIAGFEVGARTPQTIIVRGVADVETPDGVDADFGVFWQAWKFVENEYLKIGEVDGEKRVYGAISGLVQSLDDPNSVFFPPEENKKFHEELQGSFGGIGAELGIRDEKLVIIAPLKDTPANQAGLRPRDHIAKINASSTDGITIERAVDLIRGPEGTKVTLTIEREEWENPRDIEIVRGIIDIPTLDFEMKESGIAYFGLHSFNAKASFLFYRAANDSMREGAKGIVLDLRNNPGGYLDVAVDLAGWFLPRGTVVVKEVGRDGNGKEFLAEGSGALRDLPIVVLINEGSASASEILAGTLRDHRGVKLVGARSFGKGTVQQAEALKDGSSLKLTIAHWVLPGGQAIEGTGLDPDVKVERTEGDIEENRDPQLTSAIELLEEEISRR